MNATATVLDMIERRRDLLTWAVRNLGVSKEAFNSPEYVNKTPDELRGVIAAMADEKGIDITIHDEEPQWQYVLPVVPGHQMGLDCFSGMLTYGMLKDIIIPAESQRPYKKSRVTGKSGISTYVTANDGSKGKNGKRKVGFFNSVMMNIIDPDNLTHYDGISLKIGPKAQMRLPEGQHRDMGILDAILKGLPIERLDDTLPVVIYVGLSIEEEQQLFSDVNTHLVKPPRAIVIAYDQREVMNGFARALASSSTAFIGHTSQNNRAGDEPHELFTLTAVADIIAKMFDTPTTAENLDERLDEATAYWDAVEEEMMPVWCDKTFGAARNKNTLVAIGKLYGMEVDYSALACIDWANDGAVHQLIKAKGGTNAAVPAVYDYLVARVVKDKEE